MAQRNTASPAHRNPDPTPATTEATSGTVFVLPALPPAAQCTLARLATAFGAPDVELRAIVLRAFEDDALVSLGNQVAARRIVAAVPTIATSAVAVLASLDAPRASLVLLDPAIFGVLVDETAKVATLAARVGDAAKRVRTSGVAWSSANRRARRAAIVGRDVVARAVARALGADRADVVRATAGDASDDDALARGAEDLAAYVERVLAHGAAVDKAALARFRVDAARARHLRELAATVRAATSPPVTSPALTLQRELDLQEGRVLVILDVIVGALREARRANGSITMPEFGPLRSWFQPRPAKKRAPAPMATPAVG